MRAGSNPDRPLAARALAVFHFIRRQIEAGRPPTRREIAAYFGMRSHNGAGYWINRLVKEGLIEVDPEVSRGIKLKRNA